MISVSNKKWSERKIEQNLIEKCSQDNNFSNILSKLIISRNFSKEEIFSIKNNIALNNVFKFNKDFILSSDLLKESIIKKEKICILGDYDVDGSASTALLVKFFKSINHPFFFYIPDREKDGYGATIETFKKLFKKKPKLIIMVDCGSNSIEAINFLNKKKIKSLVIDHHQINKPYPKARAIINPNKDNGYYKYNYLCATALTYFFLDIVINNMKKKNNFILKDYLIFVLLATVCDVMPLRDINRVIAINALKNFSINKITGLKKIFEEVIKKNNLSIDDLGFIIGPILNSGGRLGHSDYATKLLSSENLKDVSNLSDKLINMNEKRKKIQERIIKSIDLKKIEKEKEKIILIYDPTFVEGLIGIVASKLKDKFNRPAIIMTISQDYIKGSVRSIFDFNIGIILKNALDKNLIIKGGGHRMAGGFVLKKNKLNDFKKFINFEYDKIKKNCTKNFYESKISSNSFNRLLFNEINGLNPYGTENPEPIFLFENLKIIKTKIFSEKHVSNILKSTNGYSINSIAFNCLDNNIGEYLLNYKKEISVIGSLKENFWNNKKNTQLVIKDIIIGANTTW